MTFTIRSNSFSDGDYLANAHILSADFGFGCQGNNQSPHLAWSGAPAGTKSFAVTCFDPDAPTGSRFWHWLVVNIPPGVTELDVGAGNPKSAMLRRVRCRPEPISVLPAMAVRVRRRAITRIVICSRSLRSGSSVCR